MKRSKPHQRARHARAAARELKKRQRRRWDAYFYGQFVRSQSAAVDASPVPSRAPRPPILRRVVTVDFTGRLDLTGDTASTLRQLNQISRACERDQTLVKVRMNDLEDIDAASLLFLTSRIRYYASRPGISFEGTVPSEPRALKKLQDARFVEFMVDFPRAPWDHEPNLEIAHGAAGGMLKLEIGTRTRQFLQSRASNLSKEELASVYLAVMECLGNIRDHAYGRTGTRREGWYVVGMYDDESSTSSVAILDMGVGIRSTLAGKIPLSIKRLFTTDADYVEEATRGLRTESGEAKRGKGLKTIRAFVEREAGRTLHVLSSGAVISCTASGTRKQTDGPMVGTIVCVEICNLPKSRRSPPR